MVSRDSNGEGSENGTTKRLGATLLIDGHVYTRITESMAEQIPLELRRTSAG